MADFYLTCSSLVITLVLPTLLVIGILISQLPVRARECVKTSQNNIHEDIQLDDGHGADLDDLSYLLCI